MTKTTRLMLAVLAVCGTSAAMAQSSVNLYGRVNTSVEHQKLGNASATGMVTNSSFIGFRGTEDLGNGLKAGFVLEANFNSDDGAGSDEGAFNFKRNSEINLAGGFGMLRMGSFDPYSYSVTADSISMFNHDTGTTSDMLYAFTAGRGNTLAYRTPNISGFDAEIQYRFGEKADVNSGYEDKGGFDLGAQYSAGPLGLGFGYTKQKQQSIWNTTTQQQFALRASYTIDQFTLGAYYQKAKTSFNAQNWKRDIYRLAAMYTFGASEIHANVGKSSKQKLDGTAVSDSSTQWTIGYNYNLSKRTKVYAFYTNLNHVTDVVNSPVSFESITSNNSGNNKFSGYGIGVRHLF